MQELGRKADKSPHVVGEQSVCQSVPGQEKNSNYLGTHENKEFLPHPPTAVNNVLLKILPLL